MNQFDELREHYQKMFSMVDVFHFNSQHTREVFSSCLGFELKGEVESITHEEIRDRREKREFSPNMVRLAFIGGVAPYKGFPLLMDLLKVIGREGMNNWQLSVYGGKSVDDRGGESSVRWMGSFNPKETDRVYRGVDLLVVPSICHETFGLVVLEAISRGVPILVSSTVGAKDIVEKIDGNFIFTDECGLKEKLKNILAHPSEILGEFNALIMDMDWCFDMESHWSKIKSLYERR